MVWDSQEQVNEDSSQPAAEATRGKIHTHFHLFNLFILLKRKAGSPSCSTIRG